MTSMDPDDPEVVERERQKLRDRFAKQDQSDEKGEPDDHAPEDTDSES